MRNGPTLIRLSDTSLFEQTQKPAYGRFAHNGGLTYGDKAIQARGREGKERERHEGEREGEREKEKERKSWRYV